MTWWSLHQLPEVPPPNMVGLHSPTLNTSQWVGIKRQCMSHLVHIPRPYANHSRWAGSSAIMNAAMLGCSDAWVQPCRGQWAVASEYPTLGSVPGFTVQRGTLPSHQAAFHVKPFPISLLQRAPRYGLLFAYQKGVLTQNLSGGLMWS